MKFAITGGTGFVGGHLARALAACGHQSVLIARGADRRDPAVRELPGAAFAASDLGDEDVLARAMEGCVAVAHCAGINRERGRQTFARVHVEGTRNVVRAAARAGVRRIALLSFLRARPDCGSPYHESKWEAEEIVRASGLDFTVLRAGVIYGVGDHMLDHLGRAVLTFPLFPLVGLESRRFRPVAVEDVVRILEAVLVEARLAGRTVPVVGPESMPFESAVERVAAALGKGARLFRLPVRAHLILAAVLERLMEVPLVSSAQVRILAEGAEEPAMPTSELPADLVPRKRLDSLAIQAGLPRPEAFRWRDFCPWSPS